MQWILRRRCRHGHGEKLGRVEVQVGDRPSLSVGLGWRRLIAEEEQTTP